MRRRECQVEEVYSDRHKFLCEGDEITSFTWLGEEGSQAEEDSQDLQISSQGLYRAVTQSTNSGTRLSLGLNSVSATS